MVHVNPHEAERPLSPCDGASGEGTAGEGLPASSVEPPADSTPGVDERNELLASMAKRVLADMGASAVNVYLYDAESRSLIAVVVAATPLGNGSVERVPVDEPIYASATAFRTGEITTAHSIEELGRHPEFAVFAPFPFTVSSVPLASDRRRFGAVATYWPRMCRTLTDEDRRYLQDLSADTVRELDRLADQGVPMRPPRVPQVVSSFGGGAVTGAQPGERSNATAPFVYHLHKLANALVGAEGTAEAADLALERITHGFGAQAMVLSLVEGDRLHVIGATGCSRAFLRDLNGRPLGARSPETDAVSRKRRIVQGPLDDADSEPDGPERDQVWVVLPLLAGSHAVGSCSIGFRPEHTGVLTEDSVLIALATLLGQTFARTRLHDTQHTLARRLQQTLLPRTLPQRAGVVTTTRYVPTGGGIELGGDWYDVIDLPDGGIGAVIGDVQGHNICAAVIMGQLRTAVRAYAAEGHDPGTVLSRTNRLLHDLDTDRFVTCCCVWLNPATGVAETATAGHHLPLIRGPDGEYHAPDVEPGVPLGIEPDVHYQTTTTTLDPGSLFTLYTDGMIQCSEQQSTHKVAAELEAALAESGEELETLGDRMIEGVTARPGRADDAALLLMRYEGTSAAAQPQVRRLAIQRRDLQGVGRAREFLREWLRSVELAALAEETELLASEVVTNALIHGDGDVHMDLRRYPNRVRVEVRDSDPHLALPVSISLAEDEAEDGRGLLIVSAIASAWGNSPSGRGKTVWFELPAPNTAGRREEPADDATLSPASKG